MADPTETTPAPPAAAPPEAKQAAADTTGAAATEASNAAPPDDPSAQPAEIAPPPPVAPPPQAVPVNDAQSATRAQAEWRVIGETVPGASHLRAGLPNQDALLHVRQSSARLPVIVSISDGHGSNKCFRSDRGARFAVRVGVDLLDELINGRHAALPPAEIEGKVREPLTAEFIKRWRALVAADMTREPFREEEFTRMIEKDGANARRLVEANPFLAYGATSLSFLLTPEYALYLQLGDGEMITVNASGEVTQPLPEDARLLANETTSLCLDKAAADFRFAVQPHGEGDLPALILMTTDGYYNSFSTTAGFYQVGSDLLQMLREEDGFGTVNRNVRSWLEEATTAGSGDDCTLVLICRMDALTETYAANDTTATAVSPAAPRDITPAQTPSAQSTAPTVSAAPPAASHEQPAPPKTA